MSEVRDRHEFIESEITRAHESEPNEWKKDYYENAAKYLAKNRYIEGGKICAYCREQGMSEPHHHNVWGAMIASLRKLGWVTKVGMIEPTTKHTHINSVCQWESNLYK
jgi:hypothetical protein